MGPDHVNPKVLKECADELTKPLFLLFNGSLRQCKFPDCWKVAFVTAIHKKDDKCIPSHYRPISLLSCISKVMEKCVFIAVYQHLKDNHLITPYQSGFQPGDNTVNQLIDIYDTICQSLDDGKEVRAVFCDIQKAFDRVWHKGLLEKLKGYGIQGDLHKWFQDYLTNRRQCVVLDGCKSTMKPMNAGVPQGSILGPMLFILYINDIITDIVCHIRLFADDTTLYLIVENPEESARIINSDLEKISTWAKNWLVKFSPPKTKSITFSRLRNRPVHPPLVFDNTAIDEEENHKHLGVVLSHDGTWTAQVNSMVCRGNKALNVLRKLKRVLDRKTLYRLYCSQVRPLLEYADCVWVNLTQELVEKLEELNREAARLIIGAPRGTRHCLLYKESGLEKLEDRRRKHKLTLYFKMKKELVPPYLSLRARVPPYQPHGHYLRNREDDNVMQTNTSSYKNSFIHSTIRDWNSLPARYRDLNQDVATFKSKLNSDKPKVPEYYFTGLRKYQMIHANMRTQSTNLNFHLYERYLSDDCSCECGAVVEDPSHYLRECVRYRAIRTEIFGHHVPCINDLLFGSNSLNTDQNKELFLKVLDFIAQSKRFG